MTGWHFRLRALPVPAWKMDTGGQLASLCLGGVLMLDGRLAGVGRGGVLSRRLFVPRLGLHTPLLTCEDGQSRCLCEPALREG